jgi:hypothetical protein
LITSARQPRDPRWAAARRAAARAHHPDVGGDPSAFIAALTAIDAAYGYATKRGDRGEAVTVVVRRARWRRVAAVVTYAVRRVVPTRQRYAQL